MYEWFPKVCTCKWKGGKQTVECINASLSNIPNIEAGTQVQYIYLGQEAHSFSYAVHSTFLSFLARLG